MNPEPEQRLADALEAQAFLPPPRRRVPAPRPPRVGPALLAALLVGVLLGVLLALVSLFAPGVL